jgi:hypothetical protein
MKFSVVGIFDISFHQEVHHTTHPQIMVFQDLVDAIATAGDNGDALLQCALSMQEHNMKLKDFIAELDAKVAHGNNCSIWNLFFSFTSQQRCASILYSYQHSLTFPL